MLIFASELINKKYQTMRNSIPSNVSAEIQAAIINNQSNVVNSAKARKVNKALVYSLVWGAVLAVVIISLSAAGLVPKY